MCPSIRRWALRIKSASNVGRIGHFGRNPGEVYSGIAAYRKTFDLPDGHRVGGDSPLFLHLGDVQVMARVRVNGIDCGTVWTAPWRVEISRSVKTTGNVLEIEVANLWPNRMIGDAASPDKQYAHSTFRPYKAAIRSCHRVARACSMEKVQD